MIRNGFLIRDEKIFDTKIQSFTLKKEINGENVIYSMIPSFYKRLYKFEPLLYAFSIDEVFKILDYNKILKKQREDIISDAKSHYMTNAAVIFNYPPTYLTKRRFSLYKICQGLKKKID
ncbi:MAG: hypothetical protein QM499_01035 [Flavobacteriaceae bacterium]